MVQESVSDAFRGRVMSLYALAFTGVMPFAALGVARLADVIGMRRELLFAAGGLCHLRHAIDANAPQNQSRDAT